jgi:Mrp family chromosome partitioning ATPase
VRFEDPISVAAPIADPTLATLLSPPDPAIEPFRVLRAKLKVLDEQRPLRCVGVVSATHGEGATTVALGLSAALAQHPDCRVLLVEATLREPALERCLGLAEATGLSHWLDLSWDGALPLRRVEPWGFALLPAGERNAAPGEALGSQRMAELLSEARARFDFVVIDCPPLGHAADALFLQNLLDGFLLVVRARHAARDEVRRALGHLKPDSVRGLVFNRRDEILGRWSNRTARARG